ncbi:glycosyltransferase [Flavilitoribacter nigricans]|uniref:Group 1 glycosyl transferase n=1 Tax=Flavilitoribacter nigricans (strain ATCC 23147 / DSM 23189 / NBRC 102662 / NCIMB 1420 / SS-2) TaxID=1122177 RepID=A0A2D0NIT0_FLAN2|nr:glycosyltransferase [Flavilitoribacter nigricans]PHN08401.1 group 1 glycosyl transferase [Flavilitoribacter nigricans DSM 23189 = NBRC 102662]
MNTDSIDIIYFSLFPWDHPYSSVSLCMAREFAQTNRVFYINHPHTLKDFVTGFKEESVQDRMGDLLKGKMRYESIPNLPDKVIGVHPPLTLPINWLPEGKIYERGFEWNNDKVLETIRKVIADYDLKDFIYINCYDPYYCPVLPRDTGVRLNVYQCIDDISQDDYTVRHGVRLEEEAIRRADIGLVTSSRLYELKSPLNPNLYVLNNAADVELFYQAQNKKQDRPAEIRNLSGPIIGYTGNLDDYRIDYPLLREIALAHTDKTLLLVGPVNSGQFEEQGLHELPNVVHTGGKNIRELPAYLQYMDCVIIPFLCNELTASIYPLKINEYLAAGKSVISTNFSRDIRQFADQIRLVENRAEFIEAIPAAITDNSTVQKAERLARARKNTWSSRVETFWEIIEKHWDRPKVKETVSNDHL